MHSHSTANLSFSFSTSMLLQYRGVCSPFGTGRRDPSNNVQYTVKIYVHTVDINNKEVVIMHATVCSYCTDSAVATSIATERTLK